MRRTLQILSVLLVLDLIGGGLLWFGYSNMQNKKTEKGDIQKELALENQKGIKLKSLQRTLALAEQDHVTLEKYLFDPSEESQITFLSLLERFGVKTTGAEVVTSTFNLTLTEPKGIHAELAISGTWKQLYHLLRIIEALPTHVVISRYTVTRENTTIGGSETSPWKGVLTFDIMSLKTTQP